MIILCDVDGVVCDLVKGALEWLHYTGLGKLEEKDIHNVSFAKCLNHDQHQAIQEWARRIGTASELEPYEGAAAFVSELRQMGDLYFVTAPWHAPTWAREREEWIQRHFHVSADRVIHARPEAKALVQGNIMIEDTHTNLDSWCDMADFEDFGILLARPWNMPGRDRHHIAHDYRQCLDLARKHRHFAK